MSRIRGKNTKPEMLVRRYLHAHGFRYKLHDKTLPGKPDIILPKYKTAVFVNGCFWHGHGGCRYFVVPKTKTEWWTEKINRTVSKDGKTAETLAAAGWKVITVWECELKGDKLAQTLQELFDKIVS